MHVRTICLRKGKSARAKDTKSIVTITCLRKQVEERELGQEGESQRQLWHYQAQEAQDWPFLGRKSTQRKAWRRCRSTQTP